MAFSRSYTLLPVTAIEVESRCLNLDILLVGEGPVVRLFSLGQHSLLSSIQVFQTQAIHGISSSTASEKANEVAFVVWGGRSTCVIQLLALEEKGKEELSGWKMICYPEQHQNDWILDARLVSCTSIEDFQIIYLDAHNDVYTLSPRLNKTNLADLKAILLASGPPSALYSGHIELHQDGKILIASGTVFGGVHIWTANIRETQSRKSVVHYSGHEGSVYGIIIARIKTFDRVQPFIVSCSDDRTVKIWNIPLNEQNWQLTINSSEPETGFTQDIDRTKISQPMCSGTAHLSRIWHVAIYIKSNGEEGLISFGEDATAQLWDIQGGMEDLNLVKSKLLNLHSGKNIWARQILKMNQDNRTRLVTGGADGRITLTDLDTIHRSLRWSGAQGEKIENFTESFRNYCWLNCGNILGTTAEGNIALGAIHRNGNLSITWTFIENVTALARYSVMTRIDDDRAIIANDTGSIFLFSASNLSLTAISSKQNDRRCKISNMWNAISINEDKKTAVRFGCQVLGLDELRIKELDNDQLEYSGKYEVSGLPSGFMVTSALSITTKLVVLGSRNGQLAISQPKDMTRPSKCSVKGEIHGKEAITSIFLLQDEDWILTTGRDGCFKIHQICSYNSGIHLNTMHSSKLPFGPDIEGATLHGKEIHVWGFRGTELVLWNHSLQQELWSIDIGGQHRSWSFLYGSPSALAWTRGGQSNVAILEPATTLLQRDTHGREIKALAIRNHSDELGQLVATGAEDTCIRLSRYSATNELQTLDVLPLHTTGLQKLAWSPKGDLLFSAAGKEEFLVWCVQQVPIIDVGIQLLARCPDITETRILRIMDFDIVFKENYEIIMVYSDSSIRTWRFDLKTHQFELLAETYYSTRCITQCKIIDEYLLTASTDGFLVLWRRQDLSQVSKRQVHQSSIKCLDISRRGKILVIATGGDDNALALTMLDISILPNWQILSIPRAHAAALNALVFLPWSEGWTTLVTTSNDQRVKKWKVCIEDETHIPRLNVQKPLDCSSSVADVSCIDLLYKDGLFNIVIAGVGIEVWNVDEEIN